MKIIYWTELFPPDISGVGVLGQDLLPALQKKGIDFIIVTSHGRFNRPNIDEFEGIPIYRFPFHSALINKNIAGIKYIINKLNEIKQTINPDIVHLNSSEPSLFFYQHSKLKHVPSFVTIHLYINEIHNKNALFFRVLKKSNWITTVSQDTLLLIQKLLPEITSRSSYVNNAIKTPVLKPDELDDRFQKILFIGRLAEDKGVDVALKAFSIIVKSFKKARLIIAGDGPDFKKLRNLSIQHNLSKFVTFTKEVSTTYVPKLINSVNLIIIPSKSDEQCPIVALQAGIMERPVIASDVGGVREVVQDNITGLFFYNNNPKELADKISYLLNNQSIAKKLGKSARRRVINDYNFGKCVDSYENIYKKIMNSEA